MSTPSKKSKSVPITSGARIITKSSGGQEAKSPPSGGQGTPRHSSGGQEAKSPPSGGQGTKSPPSGGQGTKSPPSGGQGTKSPPSGGQGTKSPPSGGQGTKSPPSGGHGTKSPPSGGQGTMSPPSGGQGTKSLPSGGPGTKSPPSGGQGKPRQSSGRQEAKSKTSGRQDAVSLDREDLFLNRELSWLEFNRRVLEEAEDQSHPLFERLKFLSIFATNLDEFFMIRVAGIKEQLYSGVTELSPDGMTPAEQMKEIRIRLAPLYKWQSRIYRRQVLPQLAREDIHILSFANLTSEEKSGLERDFVDNIMPVLTPLALDMSHPFPRLINRSVNVIFTLKELMMGGPEVRYAVLQLPQALARLIRIDRSSGNHFVLLDDIIKSYAGILFPGLELVEAHAFRITRDADVEIAEDEANDLITAIAEGVRQRRWGTDAVRLEISPDMPRYVTQILVKALDIEQQDVYITDVPLNLQEFLSLMNVDRRKLKDPPVMSRSVAGFNSEDGNIFDILKEGDILVHHPFDSFSGSVVRFVKASAVDPNVLAVKITLYRAGGTSPVIEALKEAALAGKSVTAFVELKARFDEENNIVWARTLEQSGVHVVYGVMGLKTHCKVCLIIRKEGRDVLTYAHVGTGNYNLATSRQYTDVGIFTARQEYERDFVHLFNMLTGYSKHQDWQHLGVAPVNLREYVINLIQREARIAQAGGMGHIKAQMNALVDPAVIVELYRASQAGVKIDLIVRGICALRPGIKGISDNIVVRSILGRFLEHSRIFWFGNGGEPDVYISSADWMTRNMERRVEIMFPVYDNRLRARLLGILDTYLSDNVRARELRSDGAYVRLKAATDRVNAQDALLRSTRNHRRTHGR